MPYQLVKKLQELMNTPFEAAPNTILGSTACVLPDHVLEQVDAIALAAENTFGKRVQPTQQQTYILEKCGFEVKPHDVTCGVWKSARIVTPRGIIQYG